MRLCGMTVSISRLGVFLIPYVAIGCVPAAIRGTVADVRGEPLPAVAVKLDAGDETITNALGEYRIRAKPGPAKLSFMKTGYTVGQLNVEVSGTGTVAAPPVLLWRLPDSSGVFFLENHAYRRTAYAEPLPFTLDNKTVLFGIRTGDMVQTSNLSPRLLCFQVPSFDAVLCRMKTIQAVPLDSVGTPRDIWVVDVPIAIKLAPVDEPERKLWEVRLFEPLEPGIYCVHWGALQGYMSVDPRVYAFEVAAPETAAGNQETGAK